jgi:hypothetical protein
MADRPMRMLSGSIGGFEEIANAVIVVLSKGGAVGILSMHSGEQTRIRSAAANSMLQRHSSVVLRLTERGFELTSEGEKEPVICESWPRAKRVLKRLGVPDHKIDVISSRLSEGTEIVVRSRI